MKIDDDEFGDEDNDEDDDNEHNDSVFDFDGWVYDGDEVDNDEDDYKVQETVYNNADEEEFNEVDFKVDGNDEVITG